MVLIAAVAVIGTLWYVPFHPEAFRLLVAVNAAMLAIAAVGWLALVTVARRRPEVVVFIALVAVDGATIAIALGQPTLSLVAVGYLLLLPVIVSLLIAWSTAIHVGWLGLHAGMSLCYMAFAPGSSVPGDAREQFFGLLVVAIAVSQFGHVTGLRGRVRNFTQIQEIRALNRAARRDEARLDRLLTATAQSAATDALTGLGNRLALKAALKLAGSRIERHDDAYGVLMLDLDRFKAINDERGHLAGDEVLRAAGHAMRSVLRPGDTAFRYGGEEFVVLLRLARPDDALAAGERIRKAVEDLQIPNPGNAPFGHVTISVGVTTIASNDGPTDHEAWLARADAALYRAKENGRNRCEVGIDDEVEVAHRKEPEIDSPASGRRADGLSLTPPPIA